MLHEAEHFLRQPSEIIHVLSVGTTTSQFSFAHDDLPSVGIKSSSCALRIFDVGHGHCAVITAPNGRRMMLDCGDRWGDDRFWTPSLHYFGQTIDLLGLLNLDEDHLSDFQGMIDDCKVNWLLTNPTVGAREFAALKSDGMGSGAKAFIRWLNAPKGMTAAVQPNFGPVAIKWYYLRYLPGQANTTNNLSLVVIVQFGAFKIVFAGDLEVSGWRRMLASPEFRRDLLGTNVFVASHHGREERLLHQVVRLAAPGDHHHLG